MFATGIRIFRPKINGMMGYSIPLMGCYLSIPESEVVGVCLGAAELLPGREAELSK